MLGMVPLTIDVIGRVLGQAFVFVFAPIIGLGGLIGKLLTTWLLSYTRNAQGCRAFFPCSLATLLRMAEQKRSMDMM